MNLESQKSVKLASMKKGAQIYDKYIIMSSLTVILSSLNCDLKTDTKPNTCPTKLSRSSCNNKKLYALPINYTL